MGVSFGIAVVLAVERDLETAEDTEGAGETLHYIPCVNSCGRAPSLSMCQFRPPDGSSRSHAISSILMPRLCGEEGTSSALRKDHMERTHLKMSAALENCPDMSSLAIYLASPSTALSVPYSQSDHVTRTLHVAVWCIYLVQ